MTENERSDRIPASIFTNADLKEPFKIIKHGHKCISDQIRPDSTKIYQKLTELMRLERTKSDQIRLETTKSDVFVRPDRTNFD